jgi:peptidoglycan/LPS O-acetylase OafA/YrhL
MRHRRADRTLIVAGLATIALGALLLLDRTGTIDVQFNYMLPAVLAAIGAVLLTAGLGE